MSRAMRGRQGVTLFELLVASVIGFIVILGLGQLDVTRIYLSEEVRHRARGPAEAMLAMGSVIKGLEQADIAELAGDNCGPILTGSPVSCIKFRIPTGPNFDNPTNYRWAQYHFSSSRGGVVFYDDTVNGCGTAPDRIYRDLASLDMRWKDESITPPGGSEPLAPTLDDNNVIEIEISWDDPTSQVRRAYTGQATLRAGAYTDLPSGLSPINVAFPPPGSCS